MKLIEIRPCSENKNILMIEGHINLNTDMNNIFCVIKQNQIFKKATYIASLNMIWVKLTNNDVIIFETGRIIINKLINIKDAEAKAKTVENILKNI